MAIEFDCTQCGKPLFAQDRYAGRPIRCPGCGLEMAIPVPAWFAQAATAPPEPSPHPSNRTGVPAPGELFHLGFEAFKRDWLLGVVLNVAYWMAMAAAGLTLWLTLGWSSLAPSLADGNPYRSGGFWIAQLALWALSALLTSGLYRAGVKMAGQVLDQAATRPNFGDFFSGLQRPLAVLGVWFPLFVATHLLNILWHASQWLFPAAPSALTSVAIQGAIVLIHVLFFVRLFWAVPLVMESSLGAWDAMAASWHMTSGCGGTALVAWVMAASFYAAGFCFCMVGMFVTSVLAQCLIGVFYRRLTSAQFRAAA